VRIVEMDKIVKMDKHGRIWIPKVIRDKIKANKFTIDIKDGKIVLTPIRKVKVLLEDGEVIEM